MADSKSKHTVKAEPEKKSNEETSEVKAESSQAKSPAKKRGHIRIERRKRGPETYIEAHNKAVKAYKRNCSVFIFIGIFNVIGSIFFVVYVEEISSMMGEFLCMGMDLFLFMREPIGFFVVDYLPWTIFLYLGVFFGTSAVITWLGVYARMGKKKYFYASCIIYIIDWIFVIFLYIFQNDFTYYLAEDNWNYNVSLIAIIHIITAVFVVRAYLNFRKVYTIEYAHLHPEEVKDYVKVDKKAMRKAKKEEAKQTAIAETASEIPSETLINNEIEENTPPLEEGNINETSEEVSSGKE